VVWRVEGTPTRAMNGTAELDCHLFTKQVEFYRVFRPRPVMIEQPPPSTPQMQDYLQVVEGMRGLGYSTTQKAVNCADCGGGTFEPTPKATWPELKGENGSHPACDAVLRIAAATSVGGVAMTFPKPTTTCGANPFCQRSPPWAACALNATLPGREPSHWLPPDLQTERRKRRRRKARGRRASSPTPGRVSIYPPLLCCGGAGMLLLLVYTLAEGLGARYQADHSPFAQPVYYYPEGKVHLFNNSSTKSWPRRVATSYLRKKHPRDPTVTGDGWILSDGRRVRDSTGGVHGSLYAWKVFLGVHHSYRVRYEGGANHGREPSRVRLENQEPVATMRALAQPGYIPQPPAEPTTESRPPETVTDQGPAMGAGGDRRPQNETLVAVALARLRRRHRQHQSEILCATALATWDWRRPRTRPTTRARWPRRPGLPSSG
jgi:hypothetical protein